MHCYYEIKLLHTIINTPSNSTLSQNIGQTLKWVCSGSISRKEDLVITYIENILRFSNSG